MSSQCTVTATFVPPTGSHNHQTHGVFPFHSLPPELRLRTISFLPIPESPLQGIAFPDKIEEGPDDIVVNPELESFAQEATWRSLIRVSKEWYQEFAPLYYQARAPRVLRVADFIKLITTATELCLDNIRTIEYLIQQPEGISQTVKILGTRGKLGKLPSLTIVYLPNNYRISSRRRVCYRYPVKKHERGRHGVRRLSTVDPFVLKQMDEDTGCALFSLIYDGRHNILSGRQRRVHAVEATPELQGISGVYALAIEIEGT